MFLAPNFSIENMPCFGKFRKSCGYKITVSVDEKSFHSIVCDMTHSALFRMILLMAIASFGVSACDKQEKSETASASSAPQEPLGIGALGNIEPRSRVLRISHNAGPEGAKIDQLLVDEAQDIEKDAVLAVLADFPRKQAEADQAQASVKALEARYEVQKLALDYAGKNFARGQKLSREKAISTLEMENIEQQYKQAKAALDEIKAQIDSARASHAIALENLANMTIRAPISGTVLRILARSGERLDAAGLLEMADLSRLDAVAEIYERDIPLVKIGQVAHITLVGAPEGVQKTYEGIVREIGFQVRGNDLNDTDPLADRDNRVVSIRITLNDEAVPVLRHQLYRQVQVLIRP